MPNITMNKMKNGLKPHAKFMATLVTDTFTCVLTFRIQALSVSSVKFSGGKVAHRQEVVLASVKEKNSKLHSDRRSIKHIGLCQGKETVKGALLYRFIASFFYDY